MQLHAPEPNAAVIAALDGVAQVAYGQASFAAQYRWAAAAQPDGLVMAVEDGDVIGAGCAVAYPEAGFGWIGLIATLPAHQRRGVGEAVTERCVELLGRYGCAPVLDASAAGAPLYERMGFSDHGITTIVQYAGPSEPATLGSADPDRCVRAMRPDDLSAVVELDRMAFGAPRAALLGAMSGDAGARSVVLERVGEPVGFAIGQESAIGPIVGPDSAGIAALVRGMLALGWQVPPRVMVPPGAEAAGELDALGFQPVRQLRHMRRGIEKLPIDAQRYAGRATLGLG